MTVEQAREVLEQYGSASVELDTLMVHIKTNKRRMMILEKMTDPSEEERAQAQAEVKRLCRDALREVRKVAKINREIMAALRRMPTPKYRDVLMLKYVKRLKREEIAERMHYDVSSVYRIHQAALEEFSRQNVALF